MKAIILISEASLPCLFQKFVQTLASLIFTNGELLHKNPSFQKYFTEIRFLMSDRFRQLVPAVREGLLTVHISSDTCQDHEKFSQ